MKEGLNILKSYQPTAMSCQFFLITENALFRLSHSALSSLPKGSTSKTVKQCGFISPRFSQ